MSRFPVTDHCDGSRFFTPGAPPPKKFTDVLRWRFNRRVTDWDPHPITPQPTPPAPAPDSPEITATWINHSTFLLQFAGFSILTDPVFSERIGILGRIGPRRVHAPGVPFENLPKIDAVLLSHDHYDHCDLPTLRRLADTHDPLTIAPLGFRPLLRRAKLTRLVELDWWQTHTLSHSFPSLSTPSSPTARSPVLPPPSSLPPPTPCCTRAPALSITLTPAQHWSNRLTGPRCGRLWGGFFLTTLTPPARRVFFAGDTGYHPTIFHDIHARLGPPDLALLPIGAYEPHWFMRDQHVNPSEAVQLHQDLRARLSLGMHWGTFQLTDEPRLAPPAALRNALADAHLSQDSFRTMEPGRSVSV